MEVALGEKEGVGESKVVEEALVDKVSGSHNVLVNEVNVVGLLELAIRPRCRLGSLLKKCLKSWMIIKRLLRVTHKLQIF